MTLTYTVQVTDDHSGTTTQNVTVTVSGTNNAPVLSSVASTASYAEQGAAVTLSSP